MMSISKRRIGWSRLSGRLSIFVLSCFAFYFSPSACALPPAPRPLYVSFIDNIPPQGAGPSFYGLEDRRRGPAFQAALQSVVDSGELPPFVIVNRDLHLSATRFDEPRMPAGATLVRVYLTLWSDTRLGGTSGSEVLCRIFVEVVRDGQRVAKLGPFLGRTAYDLTAMTTLESRRIQFEAAARQAIEGMAHALPR